MDREREEARQDRRAALEDLVDSPAWRESVRPNLAERLGRIDRKLRGKTASLEEMRWLQGQAWVLERLVMDPLAFLREPGEG